MGTVSLGCGWACAGWTTVGKKSCDKGRGREFAEMGDSADYGHSISGCSGEESDI